MILEIIKAIILGITEGITEFLPISSTGHLILVNQFISFDKDFTIVFDIVIQLGAILAVVVYFWKKLWPFGNDKKKNQEILHLWQKTLVGVLPAIILGALLGSFIEKKLFNPWVVALALEIGGIIIEIIEKRNQKAHIISVDKISFGTAFLIGLIQCLSFIPGTSRSAATIMGALTLGVSRIAATEFSFFLAIPTMVAASGYSIIKHRSLLNSSQLLVLSVGFIVSFLVALWVIKFFIQYIQKHDFTKFGYYRVVLGLVVVIYFLLK